jgi:AmmeMemoRadiSam system protein B
MLSCYHSDRIFKMQTRKPIVAGQFYAGTPDACLAELTECLNEREITTPLPDTIVAGIVPHAGWFFSGSLAAMVFSATKKQNDSVDTFVIFGAAHRYHGLKPVLYDKGSWLTPLGEVLIDEELAQEVLQSGLAAASPGAHAYEHSIEVQIPFVQHLFPDARILPVLTSPANQAIELGAALATIAKQSDKKIVFIGSTDLTHYGPRYGFAPMGTGRKALEWASKVNDRQFIDFALGMQPEKMLSTAEKNYNACGAGAAAAAVAAAKQLGKTQGTLLLHTNSNTIMAQKMNSVSSESVGYAAIVF